MRKYSHISICLSYILLCNIPSFAQVNSQRKTCGYDIYQEIIAKEDPSQIQKRKELNKQIYSILKNKNNSSLYRRKIRGNDTVYVIPTVVHIIHNNGSENISDSRVITGLNHLNQAFRNIAPYDSSTGADVAIEFCLAQQDEYGNFSTGITRTISILTDMNMGPDNLAVKDLNRWNPTKYFNCWIVNSISSPSFPQGVAGYANGPGAHGSPTDGIVVIAGMWGSMPYASTVIAHETGHWLGLPHTFSGGCKNDDCLLDGDRICDTPPDQSTAPAGCNSTINSCTTDEDDISPNNPFRPVSMGGLGDQKDMTSNYMDYSFVCQNDFSEGQKERMRLMLLTYRSSLLNSIGCENVCPDTLTASFTASLTTALLDSTIYFTNTSLGGTDFEWFVNDTLFSTTKDTAYTFKKLGTYTIKLASRIPGYQEGCTQYYSIVVDINCQSMAAFTLSKDTIDRGDSIILTNTSTGQISHQWFLKGTFLGNFQDSTLVMNNPGNYRFYLVAYNGRCYDTTQTQLLYVNCPGTETFSTDLNINTVSPGDSVGFTNTSTGQISYQWFVNRQYINDSVNFSYQFDSMGVYAVYLVSYNGICYDTSEYTTIQVGNCNSLETDHWYLGNYFSLHFTNDTVDTSANSKMKNLYSSATISDKNTGDLLFYSDGETIWNGNRDTMLNGSGIMGDKNYLQAAQIVPMPGNSSKYYLFTLYSIDTTLRYSVIDMELDSGRGAVLPGVKNQLLLKPLLNRLVATRHCNGKDYWLVGMDPESSEFKALLITESGISTLVISTAAHANAWGCAKISPNAKKIAITYGGSQIDGKNIIEMYDFNNSTGVISDPIEIEIELVYPSIFYEVYGIAFSPDNSKLYTSGYSYWKPLYVSSKIFQFEVSSNDSMTIANSVVLLDTSWYHWIGQMQLGKDGKIYATPYVGLGMHVINEPNEKGLDCNFKYNDLLFSGISTSVIGVPSFIDNHLNEEPVKIKGKKNACEYLANQVYYITKNTCTVESFEWTISGNATMNVISEDSVSVDFGESGSVKLIVKKVTPCDILYDSLVINITVPPNLDLGPDTSLCDTMGIVLDAGNGYQTYKWQDGSNSQKFTAKQTGTYWVEITNKSKCLVVDTIKIVSENPYLPTLNLPDSFEICEGNIQILDAGAGFSTYLWNNSEADQYYTAFREGPYWVEARDSCGDLHFDTTKIIHADKNMIDLGNDTTICENSSITLKVDGEYIFYYWNDSIEISQYTVLDSGIYWVEVTDSLGCYETDTISLGILLKPENFDLGKDTTICSNTQIMLSSKGIEEKFQWQDGSSDSVQTVKQAGLYWLLATNLCGSFADSIQISMISKPYLIFPTDTLICDDDLLVINATNESATYLWNDGSADSVLQVNSAGTYWAIATNKCGDDTALIVVSYEDCEVIIPNLISPNNDGINDYFITIGLSDNVSIFVFNRWGQKVYESKNYQNNWDGGILSSDTYYYIVIDGKTGKNYNGFVKLFK